MTWQKMYGFCKEAKEEEEEAAEHISCQYEDLEKLKFLQLCKEKLKSESHIRINLKSNGENHSIS